MVLSGLPLYTMRPTIIQGSEVPSFAAPLRHLNFLTLLGDVFNTIFTFFMFSSFELMAPVRRVNSVDSPVGYPHRVMFGMQLVLPSTSKPIHVSILSAVIIVDASHVHPTNYQGGNKCNETQHFGEEHVDEKSNNQDATFVFANVLVQDVCFPLIRAYFFFELYMP